MPKRVGHLCEKMLDRDFIRAAIIGAAKHKHDRREVWKVLRDIDNKIEEMHGIVERWDFSPATPKSKVIWDESSRKERVITYVPFWPDGVMHMMIVKAMQPVLMRGMYRWSCASLPGRGGAAAKRYVTRAIRGDPKCTKYALKMDVRKFYPSIDHLILFKLLARKIKDRKFLMLLWAIEQTHPDGLAIGFHPNQWLANFFLEGLDRFIRTLDGVAYYVRYMDDMVLMGPNKRKLHAARKAVAAYLTDNLGLHLKANWQVWPLKSRDLDFVGYRFRRDNTILRRRTCLRFMRQTRRIRKKQRQKQPIPPKMAAGFCTRVGQTKGFDSALFRRKYLKNIKIKEVKEVVRRESQIRGTITKLRPRTMSQATGLHNHSAAREREAIHRDARRPDDQRL